MAAAGALAACSGPEASPSPSLSATSARSNLAGRANGAANYNFTTLDYPGLSNFNELLGINNGGRVVGYYGSGAPSDPSSGYLIYPPYNAKNFKLLEYPKAGGTIATTANNRRTEAGYFLTPKGKAHGFVYVGGIWSNYEDPRVKSGDTKILSLNDSGMAIGTFKGHSGSGVFALNVATGKFTGIDLPHSHGVATGINGNGDLCGYWTAAGTQAGFVRKNGIYTQLSYPGAKSTKFLGITAHDYIAGSYVDKSGTTHGFLLVSPLWKPGTMWKSIDDPDAAGVTVATGVNIHKAIAGYYVDKSGTTHGFIATPTAGE